MQPEQDDNDPPFFLGLFANMHRRLSDLVAPASDSLLRPDSYPIPQGRLDPQSERAGTATPSFASRGRPEDTTFDQNGAVYSEIHSGMASMHDIAASHGPAPRMTPVLNESPLHRAGLLQPKSYNATASSLSSQDVLPTPHTQDTIRLATMQLSNMPFPTPPLGSARSLSASPFVGTPVLEGLPSLALSPAVEEEPETEQEPPAGAGQGSGFIFPSHPAAGAVASSSSSRVSVASSHPSSLSLSLENVDPPSAPESLSQSTSSLPVSLDTTTTTTSTPSSTTTNTPTLPAFQPSGLTLLRPSTSSSSPASTPSSSRSASLSPTRVPSDGPPKNIPPLPSSTSSTPRPPHPPLPHTFSSSALTTSSASATPTPHTLPLPRVHFRDPSPLSLPRLGLSETTPLLGGGGMQPPLTGTTQRTLSPPTAYMYERPGGGGDSDSDGDSDRGDSDDDDEAEAEEEEGHLAREDREGAGSTGTPNGHAPYYDTLSKPPRPRRNSKSKPGRKPRWRLGKGWSASLQQSSKALKKSGKALQSKVKEAGEDAFQIAHLRTALRSIPAVLLGCLLNILDGVSYGMIIFPASGVFADLGPMGVSMFFVSAIVSQLVYTLGGSGFAGANGSMMIEVVPFFHILATSIAAEIGEDKPREIIATTLAAYALSSIITGLSFFLLGFLKLGIIVGFFPRHILVGCIGGVGVFLIVTGFAVSMRIPDDDFTASWATLRMMFLDEHMLLLWIVPLGLAVLLRAVTSRWRHQLVFPAYFIIIPMLFYIIVAAARLDLGHLRKAGWLFDMGSGTQESWYKFYSYFDFHAIRYGPLWSTLPTQFALLFFNILHPPLNVPALAVSLNEDVDTNKELVAHGYSNLLAGLVGTVPNYLVYVNTLLFYRVGGDTRISGFLLALATVVLLLIGTGPIAFIPVMVVGALIFVLGIDLVKEALWDTRHRVSKTEYITIVSIMVCMTVWDFVIGVLFGIIVSCFFFVVQNSQRRSIRAIFTGDAAMSAVRRPSVQRAYIREVAKQTTILRLQGFLFFGTITYVEETIRSLVEGPSWYHNPVRFLVLDLSLVAGVDMSSAEALVRVQRLLSAKYITLVFCGFTADSPIGKALQSVDVLGAKGVELFNNINDAMEWTENAYLRAWFRSQKIETSVTALTVPGRQDADIEQTRLAGSFIRSPRRLHMRDVANRTIASEIQPRQEAEHSTEPLNTLIKAFSSYGDIDPNKFRSMETYFVRMSVPEGYELWKQGDPSDGLYILESGVLRATYEFANPSSRIEESMVPGSVAGELSALSDSPRNATMVAENAAVLWKLSMENLQRLQMEEPELSKVFLQLVLKAAKIDYDILLSSLASRQ